MTFRCPTVLADALNECATQTQQPLAEIIREALRAHLRPGRTDRPPRGRGAAPHGRRAANAAPVPAP